MRFVVTEAYLNYTTQARDEWPAAENFFETARIIWIERLNICVTKTMRYFRFSELF
jgi:hypothetical protein